MIYGMFINKNNIVHHDDDIDQDEALRVFNIYNFSIKKILKETY